MSKIFWYNADMSMLIVLHSQFAEDLNKIWKFSKVENCAQIFLNLDEISRVRFFVTVEQLISGRINESLE